MLPPFCANSKYTWNHPFKIYNNLSDWPEEGNTDFYPQEVKRPNTSEPLLMLPNAPVTKWNQTQTVNENLKLPTSSIPKPCNWREKRNFITGLGYKVQCVGWDTSRKRHSSISGSETKREFQDFFQKHCTSEFKCQYNKQFQQLSGCKWELFPHLKDVSEHARRLQKKT